MNGNSTTPDRAAPPRADRPVMIFDGACGFCRAWIDRWRQFAGDRVDFAPYQEAADRYPQIPRAAFDEAVHLVEPDGDVSRGAAAVFRVLEIAGRRGPMRWYRAKPWVRALTERAYAVVARHRGIASWCTRALYGGSAARSTFALANHIGLRALGGIYLIALLSYWVQADGLIGRGGVLPFAEWMQSIRPQVAGVGYGHMPTLLWLHPSDGFMHLLFAAGIVCATLLLAGWFPLASAVALWTIYLSLTVIGRTFLGFQWDNLLLETGLLAILLAPWCLRLRAGRDVQPPRFALFLVWWLVFRLMLSSGAVKLLSHDASWWDLTALTYHYWTQPIPTWTAWFMNLLPVWFQKVSCLLMFAIELALPFLLWFPRRLRHVAAGGFAFLMLAILATGNYTYFNWLTLVLCCWLVDDRAWRAIASGLRRRMAFVWPALRGPRTIDDSSVDSPREAGYPSRAPAVARWMVLAPGLVILLLSTAILFGTLRMQVPWPGWVGKVYAAAAPFRSVNGYGLFAAMTKSRPEIVIEGSPDGQHWFAYEFRWKPGDVTVRPGFVAPHQPRLDWQMWFAALGSREGNPWFMNLLARLLENAPDVVDLLEHNPFPEKPPAAVRALRYEYRFTTWDERRVSGAWWTREAKDLYCPPIRLNRTGGDAI